MKARSLLKGLAWTAGAAVAALAVLVSPILYVEAFCTGTPAEQTASRFVQGEWTRSEAATYLTYPEWHIVYAYEEFAETLHDGDEHEFGYLQSIAGFWSSYCSLNAKAQEHGGGSFETRSMIYVIGTSFTVEMLGKAAYEETAGRLAAWLRGPDKTPEDMVSASMAADYASFLHQVPWYRYPFGEELAKLGSAGGTTWRSAERRFALGLEWKLKEAYASLIAKAVEASGEAALEIRSAVSNVTPERLAQIEGAVVIEEAAGAVIVETPRYRRFTETLQEIAEAGGEIVEIAGNDDIMVSVIYPSGGLVLPKGNILADMERQGFGDRRAVVGVKVADLGKFLREVGRAEGHRLEHVYDY